MCKEIELLIEDYKRKLKSISEMIDSNKNNGSINDIRKAERFTTKQSEYRTFIAELERVMAKDESSLLQSKRRKVKYKEAVQKKYPNAVCIRLTYKYEIRYHVKDGKNGKTLSNEFKTAEYAWIDVWLKIYEA